MLHLLEHLKYSSPVSGNHSKKNQNNAVWGPKVQCLFDTLHHLERRQVTRKVRFPELLLYANLPAE